jgi:hypothetical protein
MNADYYTDIVSLMQAIKYNLMNYANSGPDIKISKNKSWPIGFVFPETVMPAITIFPLSKVFNGRRSGGKQITEFRISVDIYSSRHRYLEDSKKYCLDVTNDVRNALKKYLHLPGKDGFKTSFKTEIMNQDFNEDDSGQNRDFRSKCSIEVKCLGYHQMNTERVRTEALQESDYNTFFDNVVRLVKQEATEQSFAIKNNKWITKIYKTSTYKDYILILPDNELITEDSSNNVVTVERPIRFYVVSKGYPKIQILKNNMRLADKMVTYIEKYFSVDGMAEDCIIDSIDYVSSDDNLTFTSVINVTYYCRKTFEKKYNLL